MSAPALIQFVQGMNTPSADNLNGLLQTCDTFADLQGFVGTQGMQVYVRGQNTPADGNQGTYYWNVGATPPGDGYNVIIPYASLQGGWVRLPNTMGAAGVLGDGISTLTTSSSTPVMGGINAVLTPVVTGRALVIVTGYIVNDSTGAGTFGLRWGNGPPPAQLSADTGTPFGGTLLVRAGVGGTSSPTVPMTLVGLASALPLTVPVWLDFAMFSAFGGNTSISLVELSAVEV